MEIATIGDRAYLGGDFDYVGPSVGHSALVNADTGALAETAKQTNGDVTAAVSDGAGGYFLAGKFTNLAATPRRGVAHILASGKIDRAFKANVTGTVQSLALVDDKLIIGGSLTNVADSAATNIAAVNALTGARVVGWSASANGAVNSLVASGSSIYLGGSFTSVNGSSKSRLARISTTNGVLDAAFTGAANDAVNELALTGDGSTLYAVGAFSNAYSGPTGWQSRAKVAAFSTTSGAVSTWAPAVNGTVNSVATDASTGWVYLGGQFTTVNSVPRTAFAVVDASAQVTGFDAALSGCHEAHVKENVYGLVPCTTAVNSVVLDNGRLYLGGNFVNSGTSERHNAAAFSLATLDLTSWNPVAGSRVLAIVPTPAGVLLGGELSSVGGLVRKGVAVIDVATGMGDPNFRADTNGMVIDLLPTADKTGMYVAGDFTSLNGVARQYIAKIDAATGAVNTTFNARPNNQVIQIGLAGESLYLGGKFKRLGNVPRTFAAKVDATTGVVDPSWIANAAGPSGPLRGGGMVQGLQVSPDGSKVYLAGAFNQVNGQSVTGGIAVVNGSTGARAGTLGGVQNCGSNLYWINRLYLSPDGQRLYGGDVCPDHIYQWDAVNLATPSNSTGLIWRQWCNGGMQGRFEVNGRFYYGTHGGDKGKGGRCTLYPNGPNVDQQRFMVFSQDDGYLLPYAPTFDTPMGIWSFGATSQGLLVGGDFTFAGDRNLPQQGFALFRGTP